MDNKRTYEEMFLLDSGNPDFNAVSEPIRTVLERRGAEILSIKPWDERKLAYEIRGRKRGLYILTYFLIDPRMVVEVEHDFKLDERILRVIILRRDKISEAKIHAETPATSAPVRTEDSEGSDEVAPAEVEGEGDAEEVPGAVPDETAEE